MLRDRLTYLILIDLTCSLIASCLNLSPHASF